MMKRWMQAALVLALAVWLGSTAWADDTVYWQGPTDKARQKQPGKIEEETPAGVKLKLKGKGGTKFIPAAEIQQIDYDTGVVDLLDFRKVFRPEDNAVTDQKAIAAAKTEADKTKARAKRDKNLVAALDAYKDMEGKVKGNARRYMQYKIASVLEWQSQESPDKVEDALKALDAFKTEHPGGWQIVDVLQRLGRLQEKVGKLDDARKTYEDLATLPDVSAGLKMDSEFRVARLYLRAKKYAEAEQKLESVERAMPAGDPQKAFITVYRAESQIGQGNFKEVEKKLRAAVRESNDNRLRGMAYNLLGDYYMRQAQAGEAFWQYLRVDVMYSDDPDEHAKALYNLATLFNTVKNDPVRAEDCANRLREPRFAGTLYQLRLASEKK